MLVCIIVNLKLRNSTEIDEETVTLTKSLPVGVSQLHK